MEKELHNEFEYASKLAGQKLELVEATNVIIWDECFSSDRQTTPRRGSYNYTGFSRKSRYSCR